MHACRSTLEDPTWDFDAPAVVGALDSFAGRPRTRRAVATADTHALTLAVADWLLVLEEHKDFARESMLRLAGALGKLRDGVPGDGGFLPATETRAGPAMARLDPVARALALRAQAALQGAGAEATLRLAEGSAEVDLAPGDELFREGGPCDAIFAVVSGVVAIDREAPPLHAAFGAGALVGGAASLGAVRHAFGARALGHAKVLRIEKEDLFDAMDDHFPLVRSLLGCINDEREGVMSRHGAGDDRALAGDALPPPSTVRKPHASTRAP